VSNGSTTIYMFGSVHALPPHFTWMDGRISEALADSTEIWTETDPVWHDSDRESIRRYGMDPKRNLIQVLPEEYRSRLADEMRLAGVAPSVYAHVRPWLADVLLTRGALREAGLGIHTGVEAALYYYARAHHVPTFSFESIDDQLAIYNDLPDPDQLIALEDQIDAFETAGNSLDSLMHAWYNGDDRALDQLTNLRLQQSSPRTWTDIVLRRNGEYRTLGRFLWRWGRRICVGRTACRRCCAITV
jgi:uncharacterized protein YbaP (TraB family)